MAKKPVVLWCQSCTSGYASVGEVPMICPECKQAPHWTTLKPYKPTVNDAKFLKSIKICGEP